MIANVQSLQFPKTAIVSANPMRRDMSSGIIMRSLFRGWPKNRLSQVYFHLLANRNPEFEVCQQFRVIHLSGRAESVQAPKQVAETTASVSRNEQRKRQLVQIVRNRHFIMRWLRLAQEMWYAHSWNGRVLTEQLAALRPDVVYALVGHYGLTKIVTEACQRLSIPLYLHVTDDFVTTLYENIPFSKRLQSASTEAFQRAVDYASGLSAISPVMAEEYQRRYGGNWDWYTTLVDDEIDTSVTTKDPQRLVYTGNLGLDRWKALRRLGIALREINQQQQTRYRLEIYAPPEQLQQHGAAMQVPGVIELNGWIHPSELTRLYQEAGILVHVESDDDTNSAYTQFSFSTKLSHYMMTGRCILAVGPTHLGSMRCVQDANAGLVLPSVDHADSRAQLRRFLSDQDVQHAHGRSGRQWAERWASGYRRRMEFADGLRQAASSAKISRAA